MRQIIYYLANENEMTCRFYYESTTSAMNYVKELRGLVGHRPLIIPGAAVLIFDSGDRLLLQLRQDNQMWGYPFRV